MQKIHEHHEMNKYIYMNSFIFDIYEYEKSEGWEKSEDGIGMRE